MDKYFTQQPGPDTPRTEGEEAEDEEEIQMAFINGGWAEMFGHDIINSHSHPLKPAFKLYKKMQKGEH